MGSVTKAAASLFMGQPNLSKVIKEVENEIGTPIFKRISKGIEPTEKGKEFLKCAKAILRQMENMENIFREDEANALRFNISVPRASYVAHAFSRFISELDSTRRIAINYREDNSIDTINGVLEGEFSLGIIRFEEAYEDFFLSLLADKEMEYEEIWNFSYLVLISEQSILAHKKMLTLNDLKGLTEVVHGDLSVPYLAESYLKKGTDDDHNRIFVYDRGSQFNILDNVPNSYMWVSPLPDAELKQNGLVQKQCMDIVRRSKDVIIQAKNYRRTENDKAFIAELFRVRDKLKVKGF